MLKENCELSWPRIAYLWFFFSSSSFFLSSSLMFYVLLCSYCCQRNFIARTTKLQKYRLLYWNQKQLSRVNGKAELYRLNSSQWTKHAMLCFNLLQALKRTFHSPKPVSAIPHYGKNGEQENSDVMIYNVDKCKK